MRDEDKTKAQLINELMELRLRVLELEETSTEDIKKELESVSMELALSLSEVFDSRERRLKRLPLSFPRSAKRTARGLS
jgi:hypothetical protein